MTHLDLSTTGTPSEGELQAIKTLTTHKDLQNVCIYLNGDYIGGRPNDRG